ncbi:MAG: hypothetical protein JNM98_06120 [Rhodocyclaceae bacterium]|nr:hypothetical protein [Rhodocyclaceae bacterium]
MACAGSSADRFSGPAAPDFRGASRIAGEAPLAGGRFYRRFMRLTAAQRRALNWAEDDAVLQIGGLDGRPVRRDVAERLVDLGLLVRSKTPDPIQNYWEYRPATKAHDQNSPSS